VRAQQALAAVKPLALSPPNVCSLEFIAGFKLLKEGGQQLESWQRKVVRPCSSDCSSQVRLVQWLGD